MDNLYRDLAPISESAWASIEDEARRTFTLHLAGRRVVDVASPKGAALAAVGTGHLTSPESATEGVTARVRDQSRARPAARCRPLPQRHQRGG